MQSRLCTGGRNKEFILLHVPGSKISGNKKLPLAGVAQWIEHWPVNQKVAGSFPSQGTCLGFGLGPWLGAQKRQPMDVSLPLFLPPSSLSKNK